MAPVPVQTSPSHTSVSKPCESANGSDPEYAKRLAGNNDKQKSPFYNEDISPKLTAKTRKLLEDYSGIPPSNVIAHIHSVRDKAWAIRAYPCIGSGIYLDPILPKHQSYQRVLSRVRDEGATMLEIGSFMGSDLRALVADGAPAANLIATDVVRFWDIGFEMFRDKDRFHCRFVQADMMDPNGGLRDFKHAVDIIHISKVMHQWNFDRQVEACCRLVELSRPNTMIVGDQMGGETAHELVPYPDLPGMWMHDEASWRALWDKVSELTSTRWEVDPKALSIEDMGWDRAEYQWLREDANVLMYTMTRVE
ncbi:hypothetical protein K432DRAFT_409589 [Lepidopterella palustris CBS 459.81]|uniref:Methyltransferase domain-containing protein n=1 Tax=Lepidopterella palustris CBS 459.81 TaxID=1314670 RepID=A0A8E2J9X5_9PEZI|nr:hypothetical protein K432DRAFT_409589 [Lepidopterella palustris CBS 459.81]